MTNKEKKVIFTLIGIMAVVLIIVLIVRGVNKKPVEQGKVNTENKANEEQYVTQLDDGTKLNNSTSLNSKKTYKTIEITNPQFTSKNGGSALLADLKNTGSTDFAGEEVTLVLIGENNETIKEIPTAIQSMKAGETKQWNILLTADVVNIKDIKIEAKK